MSESFEYVTLSSNDSLEFYPANKMSNFKVRLPWRMQRKGKYEVACKRFSFTNTLCTFHEVQTIYVREQGTNSGAEISLMPQRFASIEVLIRAINSVLKSDVSIGKDDRLPILGTDVHDRVITAPGLINNKVYELSFSPGLGLILGLERGGFHYLNAYKTDLYVYLDCIKSRIIADTTAPLLTTVDIGGKTFVQGEQAVIKIRKPEYVPLVDSDVSELEVQILLDTGIEPVWDYGTVSLTLHVRECVQTSC